MNNNPAIRTPGVVAWDGTTVKFHDVRAFNDFAFSFEVLADLSADARFVIQFAPESAANPCLPGTPYDAPADAVCADGLAPGATAEVVIKAGTKKDALCSGTVPCRPEKFVGLRHISGGANVRAVLVRQGPKFS